MKVDFFPRADGLVATKFTLRFLKSVDFHEKSLCFASRMKSIGKHPHPPACGGLRGKSRGFRTLNDAVSRASLMQAQNMIDEMSDACYTSRCIYIFASLGMVYTYNLLICIVPPLM